MDEQERRSFDRFVAERGPALLHAAHLLTGDRYRAQDVLQETLVSCYLRWGRLDAPEAYVRRVLYTTVVDWWRRPWTRERSVESVPDTAATADATEVHAERDRVLRSLARLPARQRAVVVLRYYEQLSEAETAQALHCSVGNVKSTSSRALHRLARDPDLNPKEEGIHGRAISPARRPRL